MIQESIYLQKKIFRIGLGAMSLSIEKRPSRSTAIDVIKTFLKAGGNFIDTANIYGFDVNDCHHNERLIADAVKNSQSKNIVIATKGGGSRPNGGWAFGGGHPKQLREACIKSLLALRQESIELYYLHGPDPSVPFLESLSALVELKKEGKIQHIGIANVTLDQIKKATTTTEIVAVQNRCNPFCKRDFNNGVIDYCAEKNIIYVPYCPLGGWYDHHQLASDPLYTKLQQKYGCSSYTLNLAWLLNKAKHIIPIPGMNTISQIQDNFSALNLILEQEDSEFIDHFPDRYEPTA